MHFKLKWLVILLHLYIDTSYASTIPDPVLDSTTNCQSYSWWCDIKFGLTMAKNLGINGILISGYAYHPSAGLHWPTGYDPQAKLNEITPGGGYARTFFNPQYNSEYTLFAMGFVDSYYKPQVQVGYAYQHYINITNSGSFKWGLGYAPFMFVKPALTNDAPIPVPGIGAVTSLKYWSVDLMVTYANPLFLNVRIDF